MPYGMSDVEYAREVQRKQSQGIPLTQPLDVAAYQRGLSQLQKQSGGSGGAKAGGTGGAGAGGAVYWGGGGGAPSISDPKVQEHIRQVTLGTRFSSDWENPYITMWGKEPQEDSRVKALERRLAELEAQNVALGSTLESLMSTPYTMPYITPYTPPVTPPTPPVTTPTQPEAIPREVTVEGVTPAQPATPAAAAARPGADAGGFRRTVTPPAGFTLPSPDRLYELWREVSGREEPGMAEYFAGPQFQSVASGNIPMWMAADPTWRLFLARLGLLRRRVGE